MNLQKLSLTRLIGYLKYPIIIISTVIITKYVSTTVGVDSKPIIYETPKTYEDINNKIHSVIEEKNINIHSHKDYADSLAGLLRIKSKELEKVTSALSRMEVKIIEKPIVITTVKDTAFSLIKEDEWIKIHAYLSKDTGSITFSARDSLTIVQYEKRRLFSNTKYIDISHANPYIKTDKAYTVSFKQTRPRLTLGPYIGYGYNINTNKFSPSIGVSIQLPLIKIK